MTEIAIIWGRLCGLAVAAPIVLLGSGRRGEEVRGKELAHASSPTRKI
jgi:hypothetical protein